MPQARGRRGLRRPKGRNDPPSKRGLKGRDVSGPMGAEPVGLQPKGGRLCEGPAYGIARRQIRLADEAEVPRPQDIRRRRAGTGTPGPVTARLREIYLDEMRRAAV